MNKDEISNRWCEEGRYYVANRNEYLRKVRVEGWDKVEKPPEDTRCDIAEWVLAQVRKANEDRDIDWLREAFPPAHAPFLGMLNENGRSIGPIALLDDGRILVRVGAPYENGSVYIIDGLEPKLIENIISFGRSPNRKYFAIGTITGIEIREGWEGDKLTELKWPTGSENSPAGYELKPIDGMPPIKKLIPFPDGKRVLLVSSKGIFVISPSQTVRLHPQNKDLEDYFDWMHEAYPEDEFEFRIDMEHGAISPDGSMIAVGSQSYFHFVFDADGELIAEIGHLSEYPHHAFFSWDGEMLALNSCHLYNGATIGVPVSLLPGLFTVPYELDPHLVLLENFSRVYAAVSRQDEFIIGDAYGYIRAFDKDGNYRWQHFVGSSIGDIDISPDGKTLLVSSYAGFLCVIKLDTGNVSPFTIGDATHQEVRRWLFWRKEKQPLAW